MALKFRRGTTAQKSGSLAFGEPFINTDLNTLQIGGASGDITLGTTGGSSAFAGVSVSASSFISGSGLKITGNAVIDGNLTLGGTITIGDATTDNVVVNADLSSSIIPNNDNAFDLGSASFRYRAIYGTNIYGTINATNGVISGSSQLSGTTIPNLSGSFTGSFKGNLAGVADYAATVATVTTGTTTDTTLYPLFSETQSPNTYISLRTHASGSFYYDGVTRRVHAEGFSGSIFATNGVVSASAQIDITSTTGYSTFSSSLATRDAAQDVLISSLQSNILSASVFNTFSTSVDSRLDAVEAETIALESFTSSFNTAFGLSGANVTVKGNLTVQGLTTQIDSTTVNIADNIIQLNGTGATNAGLVVRDATAATTTSGSFLWDTTNDKWIAGPLGSEDDVVLRTLGQTLTNKTIAAGSNTISGLTNSNLSGTAGITNANLANSTITIAGTSTALGGSITAATILGGTGVISGSAGLPAGLVSGSSQITASVFGAVSGDITITAAGVATIGANSVALGTDTTGNYMSDVSAGTGISVSHTPGEGSTATISIGQAVGTTSNVTFGNVTATGTVSGSTFTGLGNLTTYSSSVASRLVTLEGKDFTITLTGDVTGTGTVTDLANVSFATTIAANSVALGTDTTGDYVASLVAGTNITLSNNSGEGATPTIGLTNNAITIAGTSTSLGGTISAATIGNAIGAVSSSAQVTASVFGAVSGDVTISSTGVATIAANSVALGTDTTGNYVASLVAGTNITLSNNSGEGATPTIGLTNNTISGIALGSNLATLTIGTGLSGTSYNGSTGVTIANTGVTSNVAGTGVTVSGATGAVTISIGQAVATSDNVRFNSLGIGMAASATAGRIDASNDIVAFSSSDIRFKENITPIENALEKISKISGNTYDWKEENKAEHGYEGNDVGVIAQEIEAVLPQLVQTRESGYKAVKYDKLVALLIEGIKEQQTQIHSLTLEIEKLKESKGL